MTCANYLKLPVGILRSSREAPITSSGSEGAGEDFTYHKNMTKNVKKLTLYAELIDRMY